MLEIMSENSSENNKPGFVLNPDEAMSLQGALEGQRGRMVNRPELQDPDNAQLAQDRLQKVNVLIKSISTGQTPEGVNLELDSENKMILELAIDNKINSLNTNMQQDSELQNKDIYLKNITRLQEIKNRLS
jgi:hypothetical protein